MFAQNLQLFAKTVKISKKTKFLKMSDSVPSVFDVFPKMSEKSSRVPEWYTSGSWANAFDNTGWQKSPEYALIRIAAGAPDLAKSPNPPPDGPGRPRKSRHFSLRTEKLPDSAPGLAFAPQAEILSGAVFPDPRTTRPSRQTDSEARRVLRQSPTHSANVRTLRKTLAENRRQGQRHSAHCAHRAQPKPTHVHKLCTPKHRRAHLCTPRHNPRHIGREHIVHVLLLLGEEESGRILLYRIVFINEEIIRYKFLFMGIEQIATRVTLPLRAEQQRGDRMRRSHKDPNEELCGTRRNASDFARTFFHRRKKDAKRSQKGLPFSIYI